jgi:hypothetical protein
MPRFPMLRRRRVMACSKKIAGANRECTATSAFVGPIHYFALVVTISWESTAPFISIGLDGFPG